MNVRRMMLRIFIGSLVVTGVLGVSALLMPSLPFEEELLLSSALLTIYSLCGLVMAFGLAVAKRKQVVVASVICGAVSLLGWLTLVWFQSHMHWTTEETLAKIAGTATIVALALAHGGMIRLIVLRRTRGKIVCISAICSAAVVSLWAILMIWSEFDLFDDEFSQRLVGAIAIVGSLATIAAPVLARLDKIDHTDDGELGKRIAVEMTCPRCGEIGQLQANRQDKCATCGLKIKIEVQEPRCQCGYLLYGLKGDVCPECGQEIEATARWSSNAADEGDGEEIRV